MKNQMRTLIAFFIMSLVIACGANKPSTLNSDHSSSPVTHKIYGVAVSPYVAKVRMYMEANKIPYEFEEVLPLSLLRALGKEDHEKLKQISPLGQIPAYENEKTSVADSAVILQYLEDITSQNPAAKSLSAEEKAEINFLEKYADSELASSTRIILVQKIVKPLLFNVKTDEKIVEESIQKLHPMLSFLESKLAGKTYFVSERLTKADFAVLSHLGSLLRTNDLKETLENGKYPALSSYFNRLMKEKFFKVTHELS